MNIIGLLGFAGSGKGTVGDILDEEFGYQKVAFADSLKDAVSIIFGWDRKLLEGDTEVSRAYREKRDKFWSASLGRDITPRIILQQVGTEAMRDVIGENIWVQSLENKILNLENKNIVITDVRFPNEIDLVRKLGGKLIRVRRGPEPVWYDTAYNQNKTNSDDLWMLHDDKKTMETLHPNIHVSEWAWIGFPVDGIINNEGTKKDLRLAVKKCLQVTQG